jgi:23S rRNA pseudouridine1911/1915/1917 synthase
MNLKILYEDNHVIAVYKEAGVPSQPDIRNIPSLYDHVKEYIKVKYNKPGEAFAGVVHRLDSPVSGVMIFAKTSKAARRLHRDMLLGNIKKFYIALVESPAKMSDGWQLFEDNIEKVYGGSKISHSGGKASGLSCIRLGEYGRHSLLCVNIHTGRKHQIRVQLASRGMPVAGDKKYGYTGRITSLLLHALYLKFPHPVKKEEIELISGIPDRFYSIIPENPLILQNIVDIIQDFGKIKTNE